MDDDAVSQTSFYCIDGFEEGPPKTG